MYSTHEQDAHHHQHNHCLSHSSLLSPAHPQI
jgi:hypothetical protein